MEDGQFSKGLLQTPALYKYILDTSVYPRESVFLKEIREVTASHPMFFMGTAPDEGPLLEMLLKIVNAKRSIEIGVFTGYSLLLTALSIPDDGEIIAIDMDSGAFAIGLPIIKKAGVDHKIKFIESEALPILDKLLETKENEGSFDFAYVDADKVNFWNYHERLLKLLRVGGIAVYDNTLWQGSVAMDVESVAESKRPGREATIEFNKRLSGDSRVQICHVPLGDGVMICRRI